MLQHVTRESDEGTSICTQVLRSIEIKGRAWWLLNSPAASDSVRLNLSFQQTSRRCRCLPMNTILRTGPWSRFSYDFIYGQICKQSQIQLKVITGAFHFSIWRKPRQWKSPFLLLTTNLASSLIIFVTSEHAATLPFVARSTAGDFITP